MFVAAAAQGRAWGKGSWAAAHGFANRSAYQAQAPVCDFYAGGHCYTLWGEALSIDSMELKCQADVDGHLAIVETREQYVAVRDFLGDRVDDEGVAVRVGAYKLGERVRPRLFFSDVTHTRTPCRNSAWKWRDGSKTFFKKVQEDSSSNHGCGFLWLFPCDWHEGCAIWWQDDPAQPLFDFQCHDAASGYSNLYLCSHDKVPSPAPTPRPSGVPTPAPQAEKIDDDDDGLLGVSAAGVDSRTGAVAGLAVVFASLALYGAARCLRGGKRRRQEPVVARVAGLAHVAEAVPTSDATELEMAQVTSLLPDDGSSGKDPPLCEATAVTTALPVGYSPLGLGPPLRAPRRPPDLPRPPGVVAAVPAGGGAAPPEPEAAPDAASPAPPVPESSAPEAEPTPPPPPEEAPATEEAAAPAPEDDPERAAPTPPAEQPTPTEEHSQATPTPPAEQPTPTEERAAPAPPEQQSVPAPPPEQAAPTPPEDEAASTPLEAETAPPEDEAAPAPPEDDDAPAPPPEIAAPPAPEAADPLLEPDDDERSRPPDDAAGLLS